MFLLLLDLYFFFENIPQSLYGKLVVEASHAGESEIATCVVLLKLTVPQFFLNHIEVQNEKWPSRLCLIYSSIVLKQMTAYNPEQPSPLLPGEIMRD